MNTEIYVCENECGNKTYFELTEEQFKFLDWFFTQIDVELEIYPIKESSLFCRYEKKEG